MPFINADRVKETTITTGTGNIALLGAVLGFRAFYPTLSVGDTFKYFIVSTSGTEWEAGLGTVVSATTLARTTVQSSSNANAAVNFSAGLKEVGIGPTAGGETPWNPVTNTLDISVNALNDVAITSPTVNQVLKYSGTEWTNQADAVNVGTVTSVAATGGTGISVTGSPITSSGTLNITNTAPDQTVSITAGTGISATGTYPNFTVTNTAPSSGGTVTSVSGAGTVSGLTLTGTVTASGSLTLGGTLSAISLTTGVSGTLPIANGGTNAITAAAARTSLGLVIGTDVLAPTGSAANLTSFPTLNQNTTGNAATVTTNANLTGHITSTGNAAVLGSFTSAQLATALTDETGTGANVFATSPTLVTPLSNTLSAIPVVSGAGNSLTIAAGSGVTSGAGGSLILQAGLQATTGGDGKVIVKQVAGQTSNLQEWQDSSSIARLAVDTNGAIFLTAGIPTPTANFVIFASTNNYLYIQGGSNGTIIGGNGGRNSQIILNTRFEVNLGAVNRFVVTATGNVGIGINSSTINNLLSVTTPTTADSLADVLIATTATTKKGVVIQGKASQTANLQEWQNSAGTVLASVSAAGSIASNALAAIPVASGLTATVTAASGSGTIITYTATNTFTVGRTVSVTGLGITSGATLNLAGMTIATATSSQFTVVNATVGVSSGTGTATAGGNTLADAASNAVTAGPGGNRVIRAGDGVGVGKGGDVILQPGAQGSSGGNGVIRPNGVITQGENSTAIEFLNTIPQAATVATSFNNAKYRFRMDRSGVESYIIMSRGKLTVPSITNVPTIQIGENYDGQPESSGYFNEGIGSVIGNGGIGIFAGHSPRLWCYQSMTGITTSLGFGPVATSTDVAIGRAGKGILGIADGSTSTALNTTGGSLSFPSSTTAFPNSQAASNKALTSNVATITIPTAHGYVVGDNVVVAISDAVFDGTFILTAVTATTISYAKTNANVTSAAATGTVTYSPNDIPLKASAFQRINCTSASNLTGIAPPTSGTHVDGRMIRVYNVGTANLTFVHNSSLSTSSPNGNRFWNVTAADIIIAPNDYADLTYDLTSNGSGSAGWRLA